MELRWLRSRGWNRSETGFKTGTVGRFDLYPHLGLSLHLDGWTFRPEVGARETFYTQSQIPSTTTPLPGNFYRQPIRSGGRGFES